MLITDGLQAEHLRVLARAGIIISPTPPCLVYVNGCICPTCTDRHDRFIALMQGEEGVRDPLPFAFAADLAAEDSRSWQSAA